MPMLKIAFLFTDWYQVYLFLFIFMLLIVFENMIECVVTYYLVNI